MSGTSSVQSWALMHLQPSCEAGSEADSVPPGARRRPRPHACLPQERGSSIKRPAPLLPTLDLSPFPALCGRERASALPITYTHVCTEDMGSLTGRKSRLPTHNSDTCVRALPRGQHTCNFTYKYMHSCFRNIPVPVCIMMGSSLATSVSKTAQDSKARQRLS